MGALSIEEVLASEAKAIHGETRPRDVDDLQELASQQQNETRRARKDADIRTGTDEELGSVERRKAFYRSLNKFSRAALCCSGGGIRSATFCLGVIQALAMNSVAKPKPEGGGAGGSAVAGEANIDTQKQQSGGSRVETGADQSLLSRFHYLSTVSGGGYIGSWLSAWRHREDFLSVWRKLTGRPDGPDTEPAEISWLRNYSNYLTPRIGIFSADSWTGAAIYLRNLLLNWLVIVPALAVLLLLMKLSAVISVGVARTDVWWPQLAIVVIGVAFLVAGQAFVTRHRPTRRRLPEAPVLLDSGNVDQTSFLWRSLVCSMLSAAFVAGFLTSRVGADLADHHSAYGVVAVSAILGAAVFAAGWLAGWPLRWEGKDFARWTASGLVYGAMLGLGGHLFALLEPYGVGKGVAEPVWTILTAMVLGVPWVLISQLFAEIVFVGLASYERNSDADREWLGRGAGWVAAAAIVWLVVTFIAFACGHLLINGYSKLGPYIASAGGVSGIIGALIGKSAHTPAKPEDDQGFKAWVSKIGLAIAGPVFAAALVVGISVSLDLLLLDDSLVVGLSKRTMSTGYVLLWLFIGLAAAAFVAWVASYSVNINRFSLHALYRNRLIRAYLGASRQQRCPDKFSGFDEDDNFPVHLLWPPKPRADGRNTFSLFHVINITLNVVQSKRLAWQERKAESFTVSPLHSGAAYKGFRPSAEYGRARPPSGISLGTAVAISGAAASPNMGYHSSPSTTLLLALFNVRLGWWLGNPGIEGEKTYKDEGPANAIIPLLQETFGLTTDEKPYVYLSDGGHFENLGLYEMVRRRCRFILVIDAGCDPSFEFEDLGNAVRKIFIDLGIRIRLKGLDHLRTRPTTEYLKEVGGKIPYHAFGKIFYSDADGGGEDGTILYIKPAFHGADSEGAAVRSYAVAHRAFPHEPTSDQWFTEAQFESYRSLGLDIMTRILRGEEDFDPGTLEAILGGLTPTAPAQS